MAVAQSRPPSQSQSELLCCALRSRCCDCIVTVRLSQIGRSLFNRPPPPLGPTLTLVFRCISCFLSILCIVPITQSPPLISVPRPKSNGLHCTPPSNVSFVSLTPPSASPLFSSFRRLSTASTAFLRHHCQVLTGLFYDAKQHREAISAGQRSSRSRI